MERRMIDPFGVGLNPTLPWALGAWETFVARHLGPARHEGLRRTRVASTFLEPGFALRTQP